MADRRGTTIAALLRGWAELELAAEEDDRPNSRLAALRTLTGRAHPAGLGSPVYLCGMSIPQWYITRQHGRPGLVSASGTIGEPGPLAGRPGGE